MPAGLSHKKRKIDFILTLNADFRFLSYRWVRPDLSDIGGQTFLMFEIPTGKTFVKTLQQKLRRISLVFYLIMFILTPKWRSVFEICIVNFLTAIGLKNRVHYEISIVRSNSLLSIPDMQATTSTVIPSWTCTTTRRCLVCAECGLGASGCI